MCHICVLIGPENVEADKKALEEADDIARAVLEEGKTSIKTRIILNNAIENIKGQFESDLSSLMAALENSEVNSEEHTPDALTRWYFTYIFNMGYALGRMGYKFHETNVLDLLIKEIEEQLH